MFVVLPAFRTSIIQKRATDGRQRLHAAEAADTGNRGGFNRETLLETFL